MILEKLPEMPGMAYEVLRKASRDELRIQYESRQLEELNYTLQANNRRTVTAIAGASTLLGGIILLSFPMQPVLFGHPAVSTGLILFGAGALLWSLLSGE